MKVSEVMTARVISTKKESSILDVMKLMKDKNVGFVVIEENKEAIGVITDRDIVLALSKEISHHTNITKIMKKYVISINEKIPVSEASDIMGYMQVRRLVVLNDQNKIVGVLSLSDLAKCTLTEEFALETLIEISYDYPTRNYENDNLFQISAYIF